ncbi:hypothetical protein BH10BAC2_BH10BAC2_39860 [soil metagenome]
MKKLIVATLLLVACSCQKETSQNAPEQKSQAQNQESQATSLSASLSKDPDFIKLVDITQPVIQAFRKQQKFPEFKDDKVLFKECITLYRKMGFKDSSQCAQWFLSTYELATALQKKYPSATAKDYTNAFVSDPKKVCQDAATGTFLLDVTKCAAYGLVPIVGEVLAGTCMIGALVTFNSSLAACEATPVP